MFLLRISLLFFLLYSGEHKMQTENRHHGNGRIRVVLKADHKELQQQDWAEGIAFPR